MPIYVIEREIEGIGSSTDEQLKAICDSSCEVLKNMSSEIRWDHSYVTQNKLYCVYEAPNEELIREHARLGGFPIESISRVANVISPANSLESVH